MGGPGASSAGDGAAGPSGAALASTPAWGKRRPARFRSAPAARRNGSEGVPSSIPTLLPPIERLELRPSTEKDLERVMTQLRDPWRREADPEGRLNDRQPAYLEAAIARGWFWLAVVPDQGPIAALVAAYRFDIDAKPASTALPQYTEIGTGLTWLKGFRAGEACIVAAVCEAASRRPASTIVANLDPDSEAAMKAYVHRLGWEVQSGPNPEIDRTKQISLVGDAKPAGLIRATPTTVGRHAKALLHLIRAGELQSIRTGRRVKLDLRAIGEVGLSEARLIGLAAGGEPLSS